MISSEQRRARRDFLGSSDSPAILGLSPWRTALDVWCDKVYGPPEEEASTPEIETGNVLESFLVTTAASHYGVSIQTGVGCWRCAEYERIGCHVDAYAPDAQMVIEAKYVGPNHAREWGTGRFSIPPYVMVQLAHQWICKREVRLFAVVAAICDRSGLSIRHYQLAATDLERLSAVVLQRCREFWSRHVETGIRPASHWKSTAVSQLPWLSDIADKRGDDGFAELYQQWLQAREARIQAEREEKRLRNALLLEMHPCDAALISERLALVYAEESAGERVDTTALREAYPALADQFTVSTKRRVLRVLKPGRRFQETLHERRIGISGPATADAPSVG